MNNVVDFGAGRDRPRRFTPVMEDGARILFFTGVRYVRSTDDDAPPFVAEPERFCELTGSVALNADAVAARHAPV